MATLGMLGVGLGLAGIGLTVGKAMMTADANAPATKDANPTTHFEPIDFNLTNPHHISYGANLEVKQVERGIWGIPRTYWVDVDDPDAVIRTYGEPEKDLNGFTNP